MLILETRMEYDSYKWSGGETTQTVTVYRKDTTPNKENNIELKVTYWGCILRDSVSVTFLK